jgi:hypothetical protein
LGESNRGFGTDPVHDLPRHEAADPTRPVIDTSGRPAYRDRVYDIHDYEQDPSGVRRALPTGAPLYDPFANRQRYDGRKPMFVSEYGGIRWTEDKEGMGVRRRAANPRGFLARYEG